MITTQQDQKGITKREPFQNGSKVFSKGELKALNKYLVVGKQSQTPLPPYCSLLYSVDKELVRVSNFKLI